MRVAFVNASVGGSGRLKSQPVGLAYVIAYAREHGFECEGFDFGDAVEDPAWLAERYGLDGFDVVGFSVYTQSFLNAAAMAEWIKRRRPGVFVVIGGPHATATHEHIIRSHPEFDLVVRREGEETMVEVLQRLEHGQDPSSVIGTTTRSSDDGAPIVNEDRQLKKELDLLPFPDVGFHSHSGYGELVYYDEVLGRRKPGLSICSSRSCPYNCSFCGVLTIGRKYRALSPERVVEELEYFRRRHVTSYQHVYFCDANFFVSPKRALAIARALNEVDPEISFSFATRVNQVLRAATVLPELKRLGLRFIELGLESASPTVLERLAKGVTPDINVDAVKLLRRLGIEIVVDFIMLDPASTLDDVALNMEFLRDNGFYDYVPHRHLYSVLMLYQGTPIRTYYEKRLGLTFDPDGMPSPYSLFERPEVQRLCDAVQEFGRAFQPRITSALDGGERLAIRFDAHDVPRMERAHHQLDLVALRHGPNLFIDRLLDDARAGYPILSARGIEGLLPVLGHDRVRLVELVDRVDARVARYASPPRSEARLAR